MTTDKQPDPNPVLDLVCALILLTAVAMAVTLSGCTPADITSHDDGGAGTGGLGSGGVLVRGSGGLLGTGGLSSAGGAPGGAGGAGQGSDAGTDGELPGTGGSVVAGTGGAAQGTGGAGTGGTAQGTGGAGTGGAVSGAGGAGTGGAPQAPLPGQVVVTEVMMNPDVVSDDGGEWFEVANVGSAAVDLAGCLLAETGATHVVSRSLVVQPGQRAALARSSDPVMEGFVPDYSYGLTLRFNNEGVPGENGDLVKISYGGVVIDQIMYTAPTWTWISGHTISLDPAHTSATENDDPANWCIGQRLYHSNGANFGTPREVNEPCP